MRIEHRNAVEGYRKPVTAFCRVRGKIIGVKR